MTRPAVRVEIIGLKELARALREDLPASMSKRVLDGALKAGGRHIEQDAERRAPVLKEPDPRRRPGVLRKAIGMIARRDTEGHTALVVVKPRRASRSAVAAFKQRTGLHSSDNPEDPWYWFLQEYGFHDRAGKFHSNPFLRPAFEARKFQALSTIHQTLGERIKKAWAKLGWQRR